MKKTGFRKIFVLFFLLLFFTIPYTLSPIPCLFASNIGTTILPVLLETRSVRSTGLGKTFVSNSKNVASIFESSVGLYTVDSPQVSFFYNRSFADVGFGYLAFAYPFKRTSLGFGILNMQTDTFETIIDITKGEENWEERSFVRGQSDWIYTIGAGIGLSKWLNFGFNIKSFNSTLIEKYTASGVACDLGARLSFGHFDFGFSVNNNGSKAGYGYTEGKFNLPQQTQIGLNYSTKSEKFFHNFNIALEYETRTHEQINFLHSGIEWILPVSWIHPLNDVSLRAGYIFDVPDSKMQRIFCGFGIELTSILIDYSCIPYSKLGSSHYFSITYKFPVAPTELHEE
ncbi:MAG: hypothetical protein QME68_05955 [Elusimicrobiota bacterium]|nr:hypothetical protein [Elusimicrobiota bacterium]